MLASILLFIVVLTFTVSIAAKAVVPWWIHEEKLHELEEYRRATHESKAKTPSKSFSQMTRVQREKFWMDDWERRFARATLPIETQVALDSIENYSKLFAQGVVTPSEVNRNFERIEELLLKHP